MSIQAFVIRVFAAGFLLLATSAAAAVMFNVDSKDDGVDDNPGNGLCHTAAGTCTLRAAVMEANRTSGAGATIKLPAGTYLLMIGAHDADGEDNGDLNLSVPSGYSPGPTTITGAGAGVTIIDAQQIDGVLSVGAGRTLSISGVTLRNGLTTGDGGGINNAGTLTLSECTLSGNAASQYGYGGAIVNTASCIIDHCTLSGNTAGVGGGITNFVTMQLASSTVNGNTAVNGGGGIFSEGSLTVTRSTISNNASHTGGGGIGDYNSILTVTNSTIALNTADTDGGGIYQTAGAGSNTNIYSSTIAYNDADHTRDGGSGGGILITGTGGNGFNLYNTVLAGNTNGDQPLYDDCATVSGGALKTHARNLFGTTDGCTIDQISGSYAALDPPLSLGQLQNNGGPTQTIALLAGSNAIDGTSVTGSVCHDSLTTITIDQRGYPRAGVCDVGAFEYDGIFIDAFE